MTAIQGLPTPLLRELKLAVSMQPKRAQLVSKLGSESLGAHSSNADSLASWRHCEVDARDLALVARDLPIEIPAETGLIDLHSLSCSDATKATLAERLGVDSVYRQAAVTKLCGEGEREAKVLRWLSIQGMGHLVLPGVPLSLNGKSGLLMPQASMQPLGLTGEAQESRLIGIGLIHALLHCQDGKRANIAEIDGKVTAFDLGMSLLPARTCKVSADLLCVTGLKKHRLTLLSDLWNQPVFDRPVPEEYNGLISELSVNGLRLKDPAAQRALQDRIDKLKQLSACGSFTLREVFRSLYPEEMLFVEAAQELRLNTRAPICLEDVLDRALQDETKIVPLSKAYAVLTGSSMEFMDLVRARKQPL